MLFADDQVMSYSENNSRTAIYKPNKIITEYGLTISTDKSKEMAFNGRDATRSKIVINNKIIEQVNTFKYLGNLISHEKEKISTVKLQNFLKIKGIINNIQTKQSPNRYTNKII
jgi:hypothetical protein